MRGKPAGCATGCMCGGPGAARPFWAVGPRDGPSPLPDPGPAPLPTPVQAVRPVLPGAPPPPPRGSRRRGVGLRQKNPPQKKNTSARSPPPQWGGGSRRPHAAPGSRSILLPRGAGVRARSPRSAPALSLIRSETPSYRPLIAISPASHPDACRPPRPVDLPAGPFIRA